MRTLVMTRYGRLGASTRVRSIQYFPALRKYGWQLDFAPLFPDAYVKALYSNRPKWHLVTSAYMRRLAALSKAKSYDLIWIEKELFPFIPDWAEKYLNIIEVPYLVDYDDALFHRYDNNSHWIARACLGEKIDKVMRRAQIVTVGNDYIGRRAWSAGARRVEIIPTVVDLERYKVCEPSAEKQLTIGWIGSPVTSRYLRMIGPVINKIVANFSVRFVAVGGRAEDLPGLPVDVWPWDENTEAENICRFHIGIMPLPDSPWEQGKCGYKLVQYMASARPVVASPVGVNTRIVEHGRNGFLASSLPEWEEALVTLIKDEEMRRNMGLYGRKRVEAEYCLQVQAPRLEALMRQAALA